MIKRKNQSGLPLPVIELAMEVQGLVKKYQLSDFSIYIGGNSTPYGFVWVAGDIRNVTGGIHSMIEEIVKQTGKPEDEVLTWIRAGRVSVVNSVLN